MNSPYDNAIKYLKAAIRNTDMQILQKEQNKNAAIALQNKRPNEVKKILIDMFSDAIKKLKTYKLTEEQKIEANKFINEYIAYTNTIKAFEGTEGNEASTVLSDKVNDIISKIKNLEPKKTVQEYIKSNHEIFKFFIYLKNITEYETKLAAIKTKETDKDITNLLDILKNNNILSIYQNTSASHTIVELEKDINKFEISPNVIKIFNKKDLKQLIKESIMGAVRTLLRIKPYKQDSISLLNKNFSNTNVTGAIDYINYKFNQSGGYNYSDVIEITSENKLVIHSNCNTNSTKPDGYGPFAAIYPPQSDNIAIYKNLFISETDTNDGKTTINPLVVNKNPNIIKPFDSITIQQQLLMDKLNRNQTVVIFGYGMSGSGKTYVLIEGFKNENTYDPSILEQFVKQTTASGYENSLSSVEFTEIYPYGEVTGKKDLFQNYDITNTNVNYETGIRRPEKVIKSFLIDKTQTQIQEYCDEAGIDKSKIGDITNLYNKIEDTTQLTFEYISLRIRLIERHRIKHMRILPTPNNGKSSRSFFQITLTLNKGGKLVLFDMPGTENTVRIKTEFIGETLFSEINKDKDTTKVNNADDNRLSKPTKYNEDDFVVYQLSSTTNVKQTEFIKVTTAEATKNNIDVNYYDILFKAGSLAFRSDFNKFGIIFFSKKEKALSEKEKVLSEKEKALKKYHDSIIGKVSHDLTMFINGKEGNFINMNQATPLYFLTNALAFQLFTTFLKYLATFENDNGTKKYSFCSNTKENDCQIPLKKNNKIYLDQIDLEQIQKIFGFVVTIKGKPEQNITLQLIKTNSSSTNLYELPTITILDNTKMVKLSTVSSNKASINVLPDLDNSEYFYSNPIIKYIHIIISHIFNAEKQIQDANIKNKVYKVCAFFIYKYINFIVNQGKAIVTTLEHLKFFFLSKNNKVDTYDSAAPDGGKFKDSTHDLLTDSELYNIETPITTVLKINEQVNIGNMNDYQFIQILIQLSGGTIENLTSSPKTNNNKYVLNLASTVQQAIFVMLTNIKIFRDNKDDDQPFTATTPSHKQICTASIDTAKFADSIASTATISTIKTTETSTQDIEKTTDFTLTEELQQELDAANNAIITNITAIPSATISDTTPDVVKDTEKEEEFGFELGEGVKGGTGVKGGGNITNKVSNLHYNLTNRKKASLKKKNKKHYESRLLKQMTKTNV